MKGTAVCWEGEKGLRFRAYFGIEKASPHIYGIEYEKDGEWILIEQDLHPYFRITTGIRRMDRNRGLNYENRWWVYGDPPMDDIPNVETNLAQYESRRYDVKKDGARTTVEFDGVNCRFFKGRCRITVFEGSNLLRVELIMMTQEPSLAYLYEGGLAGFAAREVEYIRPDHTLKHDDVLYGPTDKVFRVRSRNRNIVACLKNGMAVGVFPPPHAFFFARQLENIVGYNFYRPERDGTILGIMHSQKGKYYEACPNHRAWACYNAPAGTEQRLGVYFYICPEKHEEAKDVFESCRNGLLAYTHKDSYKILPGYKTLVNHFHLSFGEVWNEQPDLEQDWIKLFKALGVNIACLNDFHANWHEYDNGKLRFEEQKIYFEACRQWSDENFLIMPSEEPNCGIGGHWNLYLNQPTFYSRSRGVDQPYLTETPDGDGKYYHLANIDDVYRFLKDTDGLLLTPHPETKANEGYPEDYLDTELFRSRNYLGIGFRYMPADLSFERLADGRVFDTLDKLNNLAPNPKYVLGEVDTYKKTAEYDLYGDFNVNYVKLDRVPSVDDTSELIKAFKNGDWFVTTGEVLIENYCVKDGCVEADLSWTFPIDFCEIVYSDGTSMGQQRIRLTGEKPFGRKHILMQVPEGMKWVRFTAWDCATNGAFTQPVFL